MSRSEFYYNNFTSYKAGGLEDFRASRFADARFKLLKAGEFLYKLAGVTKNTKIRKERIRNAGRLLEMAKAIDVTKPAPRETEKDDSDEAASFHAVERPKIKFSDIAGLDDVKEQVRLKMIYPFTHPEVAEKFGIKKGGGVLLYGPPGTGKTMMARAVAGEIDAAFYTVKPSEIMSKWVGEAEKNIKELFDEARKQERSIIFIDEIEALVPKRASTRSSVMARLVPQILAELEGFDSDGKNPVLFMGATNEPWSLDPAVLRPGRFDEIIYVGLPDFHARRKILEINLAGRPVDEDVDVDEIAGLLESYSGADIKNICNRSAADKFLDAVEKNVDEPITMRDILDVIEKTRPSVKPKAVKRYLAYME